MGHTFFQNYGHLVYHVEDMDIRATDLCRVHQLIESVVLQMGGRQVVVGGIETHVHLLCCFPLTVAIPDFVRGLKTTTTHAMKARLTGYRNFHWQTGYGYFSVSASKYKDVHDYIMHQRERHQRQSFDDELASLVRKNGAMSFVSLRADRRAK